LTYFSRVTIVASMTPKTALKKAIKICGGPAATARALGIKKQAVHKWKKCPPTRAIPLEAATQCEVTRHQLRPDLYPDGA
jgi:DNA-binding transcriptional regulator YdaS (Cro superfamily)